MDPRQSFQIRDLPKKTQKEQGKKGKARISLVRGVRIGKKTMCIPAILEGRWALA